jgi:hypothetical protein
MITHELMDVLKCSLIERPPDDGPVRTETYVGVVLTKINSDIECALVGFLKNKV